MKSDDDRAPRRRGSIIYACSTSTQVTPASGVETLQVCRTVSAHWGCYWSIVERRICQYWTGEGPPPRHPRFVKICQSSSGLPHTHGDGTSCQVWRNKRESAMHIFTEHFCVSVGAIFTHLTSCLPHHVFVPESLSRFQHPHNHKLPLRETLLIGEYPHNWSLGILFVFDYKKHAG
jgi:hypothetical protein